MNNQTHNKTAGISETLKALWAQLTAKPKYLQGDGWKNLARSKKGCTIGTSRLVGVKRAAFGAVDTNSPDPSVNEGPPGPSPVAASNPVPVAAPGPNRAGGINYGPAVRGMGNMFRGAGKAMMPGLSSHLQGVSASRAQPPVGATYEAPEPLLDYADVEPSYDPSADLEADLEAGRPTHAQLLELAEPMHPDELKRMLAEPTYTPQLPGARRLPKPPSWPAPQREAPVEQPGAISSAWDSYKNNFGAGVDAIGDAATNAYGQVQGLASKGVDAVSDLGLSAYNKLKGINPAAVRGPALGALRGSQAALRIGGGLGPSLEALRGAQVGAIPPAYNATDNLPPHPNAASSSPAYNATDNLPPQPNAASPEADPYPLTDADRASLASY